MKVFIEFNCKVKQDINIRGIDYKKEELNKLHLFNFPVHKYFNAFYSIITIGRFIWEEEEKCLYLKMWLTPQDINFFEKEIISGYLYPGQVRLCPDTVDEMQIKEYYDEFVENYDKYNKI